MRVVGLLLASALCACASRESPTRADSGVDAAVDTADAGKPIPAGAVDALAANIRVFCRSFEKCFPVQFGTLYGDEEGCVSRRLSLSQSVLFGPGSLLTTADIEACGRVSGTEYTCDQILRTFYENPVIPADCRLKGTLDNGTPCAGSDQCKSGYCRYELASACGVCADRVGPGGPCTMHLHCAEGFACNLGKCVAWVDRGGVRREQAVSHRRLLRARRQVRRAPVARQRVRSGAPGVRADALVQHRHQQVRSARHAWSRRAVRSARGRRARSLQVRSQVQDHQLGRVHRCLRRRCEAR